MPQTDFGDCYRIEAEIGQGGIGVVYRALDRKRGHRVALKLLRSEAVGPTQRPRFEREAKVLAALKHPNIVATLDCGVWDSVPYLVMELLEGESLAQALGPRPFPLARAESVMRELFAALGYVHARGLVHRDLKPGNVFLQRLPRGGEQLKLLDFGLAKFVAGHGEHDMSTLTRSGEVFGTPAYMPPEQWTGQAVDARADVYSAAVVCFELLAGRKPFTGDGQELLRRQLIEAAPLLHEACPERVASPGLERMLQRALAKQVGDRQRDATELIAELEALPSPWLYSGAEATEERRGAALAARDALKVATAPTLEQHAVVPAAGAEVAPRAARGGTRSRRRRSVVHGIGELLRRLIVASAWTVTAVSLLVIAAAAAVIYIMKSPERIEERAVLEQALPPLRDAITRGADAAKAAVGEAVSDATEHVSAAFPAQWQAGSGSDDVPSAARERARNPWRGPIPQPLRKARTKIDAGQRGDEGLLAELRDYNRKHPEDPRGHLLLARLFLNRGAWNEMLAQYELAFARDSSSRGDPRMLQDLVRAVSQESSAVRATELVRVVYGRDALEAVVRGRAQARSPDERARLDRLTHVLSP